MKSVFSHVFVVIVVMFWTTVCSAQLFDDFSDLDFTSNPTWNGDVDKYIINGDERLQLNDSDAGITTLQTNFSDISIENKEWRFWVKHSFSGSSNNQSRIYLSTLTNDIEFTGTTSAGAQGYFISLGEAGSEDAIRLFRDDNEGEGTVEIATGILGNVSGSFEVLIKVLHTGSDWSVFADFGGGLLFEASGTDDTYTTSTGLGVACKYTISNATSFYFDDFYFGDPEVDEDAPVVDGVLVPNENTLQVIFNEVVDESSAENSANYNVVGLGNPDNALLDDLEPFKVILTFSSAFPELVVQTLDVEEIEDASGNTMSPQSIDFTWIPISTALERDVVFNEILPDPSPSVGLPEVEYVEIYNASATGFDLEDWVFVNTSTEKTLPAFVLAPGAYVLLCDDESVDQLSDFGDVIGIPSFTLLSNGGDSLTLKNQLDDIIDIVVYSDDWYGNPQLAEGGTSLEQINPFSNCSGADNWTASLADDGGTPDGENSNFNDQLDEDAPVFEGLSIISTTTLQLYFDELILPSSLATAQFTMSEGITIASALLISENEIGLVLDPPLEVGINYELSISLLGDCEGNLIDPPVVIDVTIGFMPEAGDLVFNELLPDPDDGLASPNAEFIELLNTSDKLLDLQGVSISGGVITQQLLLSPGAYQLLASDDDELAFFVYPGTYFMSDFPGLVNTGRELEMTNPEGDQLDYLSYDLDWYGDASKDDGGYSLELINPDDPCSDRSNWTASNNNSGATPGEANSVLDFSPDEVLAKALYALTLSDVALTVIFDEPLDEVSVDSASYEFYRLVNGVEELLSTVVSDIGLEPVHVIVLTLDTPIEAGNIYIVKIEGLEDCWGNESDLVELRFALEDIPEPGDLIINEILSNPVDNGSDYMEIYNNSPRNISIKDWNMANFEDGEVSNMKLISEENRMLFPGDFLCVSVNINHIPLQYPFARVENLLQVESLPTYNNEEGTVVLVTPLGLTSDLVDYDVDMHFALLNDLNGVSLERLDYNRESNDRTNWLSAAENQNFGTPGYENSQQTAGITIEGEITIDPEVFSPDNDGVDDVVNIAYQFSDPALVGSVDIYDKQGRAIRNIAKNDLLGTSGVYSWNGLGDNNEKAPIGIYVVLFEVFDVDGLVRYFKEICVLAHQLD